MRFIEQNEKSPRAWYGGAIGMVHFNGDLNTGLTLRTIRIKDGIAEVRAGATLLYDSVPEDEEAETELKASAMLSAIRDARSGNSPSAERATARVGDGVNILLVDHEDSFVHTLANYFRQTGANVSTVRTPVADELFDRLKPDLVVLSPGPGTPKDFDAPPRSKAARATCPSSACAWASRRWPSLWRRLRQLRVPMHGKPRASGFPIPDHLLGPAQRGDGGPLPLHLRRPRHAAAELRRHAETTTASSWPSSTGKSPSRRAVPPESIMSLGHDAGMRISRTWWRTCRARQGKGRLTTMTAAPRRKAPSGRCIARLLVDRDRLRGHGAEIFAWWMTGRSRSIRRAGIIVNVITAAAAFWAIRVSHMPADRDHPFGHHKAEYFSAVLEGVLIVVAALLIIAQVWQTLRTPSTIEQPWEGLAVNGAAAVLNCIWATILIRSGRSEKSPALVADGQHIMTDVLTSAGVIAGLVAAVLTGWHLLDPLLALLVALNILYQGWKVTGESLSGLMDRAVDMDENMRIRDIISANSKGALEVHDLKTRIAGRATFIEFHMVVDAAMTVGESTSSATASRTR